MTAIQALNDYLTLLAEIMPAATAPVAASAWAVLTDLWLMAYPTSVATPAIHTATPTATKKP